MGLSEKDILYEVGDFWVLDDREHEAYTVMGPSPAFTHSISDSAYAATSEGLTIAKARVDYLARRATRT